MKIHCVRHEAFEALGIIEEWIRDKGASVRYTHTYLNQSFPDDFNFDLLILMGGTTSAWEDKTWLIEEKRFVTKALKEGKKILGICLGAQIIAQVLGARVYPGEEREIGWFSVSFNRSELKTMPFLPDQQEVFHWHGDTFDLPAGSIRLASSGIIQNQGFLFEKHVLGIQFHLEMTYDSLQKIIDGAGNDLKYSGKFIQTAEEILLRPENLASNQTLMFSIMDYLQDR